MSDIKSYIILNKKTSFIVGLFILISLVIFIFLVIISGFKYKRYYQTTGQVIKTDNYYQLSLYLTPYQLNIIKDNNILTIDNSDYTYSIKYISDEYIISNDYNNYLNVVLNINLNEKDKIVNNILQVKFLESDKKIFYYIKDFF